MPGSSSGADAGSDGNINMNGKWDNGKFLEDSETEP